MDVDALAAARGGDWDRLRELARRSRLDGREIDELITRYQTAATDLSAVASTVGDSAVGDRISLALSRARLRFTGAAPNPLREIAVFFALRLPAALYRIRWITLAIAVVCIGTAFAFGIWVVRDPQALAVIVSQMGGDAAARDYVENRFVQYYSESSEPVFAAQVWTNNAFIALRTIAIGWTGIWVPFDLLTFFRGLGESGGVMVVYGRGDDFFLYIAPHGQLELYSVFLAGGAALSIFWTLLVPGKRTRTQALREDGRAFFAVVLGVTLTMLLAGLIEGFVVRQPWPWPLRVGIGTLALAAVVAYQWIVGGRAARAGETGDVGAVDREAAQIVEG